MSGVFELSRVMKLFSQGFDHQTDEAVGDSIRHENFIDTNRMMHTRYRNRAGHADKHPDISDTFAGKKSPGATLFRGDTFRLLAGVEASYVSMVAVGKRPSPKISQALNKELQRIDRR
jgi:hypothetical protein